MEAEQYHRIKRLESFIGVPRTMLVADALADRRLIRLLPDTHDQLCHKAHVVRWPARLTADERRKAFVSWLLEQARDTTIPDQRQELSAGCECLG